MASRFRRLAQWLPPAACVGAVLAAGGIALAAGDAATQSAATQPASAGGWSVWVWPALLFVVSLVLGVVAVLGGVGGGVLFVPVVGSFFPFHLDFVRCAGLMVALSGSVAAGPGLLRKGLADLRLSLPVALIASTSSIFGAMVGLHLSQNVVQTALGATILAIAMLMLLARKSEYPGVSAPDGLARMLGIGGSYHEPSLGRDVAWTTRRTPVGLAMFVGIGFMAGMFGLGAGWANVPVLNLLMGTPLKLAVGSSKFLLAVTDSTAAWVYINNGAALPIVLVPSVVGVMLGSLVGVRLLAVAPARVVRVAVLVVLLAAGLRALLKGLNVWP
jgi:uncharacterized membrane protein YfcA